MLQGPADHAHLPRPYCQQLLVPKNKVQILPSDLLAWSSCLNLRQIPGLAELVLASMLSLELVKG